MFQYIHCVKHILRLWKGWQWQCTSATMETTDSYRNVYWIARFWSCNKWSQQQLSLYHDLNRQITRVSWDSATGWQRFHWHGCQCWLIPPRYLLLICATATGYNVLLWYKHRNRSFQQQQKALASAKPLTVESRTNAWFWWRSKLHVIVGSLQQCES